MIHSKHTAIILIKYDPTSGRNDTHIGKAEWPGFIVMVKDLQSAADHSQVPIYYRRVNALGDRDQGPLDQWEHELTRTKTALQAIKEMGRGLVVDILAIFALGFYMHLGSRDPAPLLVPMLCILLYYLITSFLLRLIGCSREEAILWCFGIAINVASTVFLVISVLEMLGLR